LFAVPDDQKRTLDGRAALCCENPNLVEATFARATMPPPCERNGETATSRGHRAASVMETHRCRSVNGGGIKVFFFVCASLLAQ